MADYTSQLDEEMASAFITSTCQLLPTSFSVHYDHMHNLVGSQWPETKEYSILCGSLAEFYIRPLSTCIDDMDFLVVLTEELVFSGDFPVLPSDFSGLADTIQCHKIVPYDNYPGFVRLQLCGDMNYNWKFKKYEINYADRDSYGAPDQNTYKDSFCLAAPNTRTMLNSISGPAIKQRSGAQNSFNYDFVRSMWCPQWPKEAQGWLNRPRFNGWPKANIISEILQNGCHVVYAQHRSCREDFLQWRFSFSLAEVILLHSWTQTQQIVYHLLRFFAKRELMQKDCPKEDEVLCTYHLKTLMLWACEEMSPQWWNSSSVIAICHELLKMLAECLRTRHCSNYFIPEANLFHDSPSPKALEKIHRRLDEFCNSGILCHWFVENYILAFIRRYLKPMETKPPFVDYTLPLLAAWNDNQFKSLEFYCCATFRYAHETCRYIMKQGVTAGVRNILKKMHAYRSYVLLAQKDLPAIENISCFTHYDILLYILETAYGIGCGEITWDGSLFVESVDAFALQPKITRSKYHNFPKACSTQGSWFEFLRAQCLMENLTGSNSRPEFQLLHIMTKEFLRKALKHDYTTCIFNGSVSKDLPHFAATECDHSQSRGIVPAALAYLAALHFASSKYHEATLCLDVFVKQAYKKDTQTLNAGCLLFIDDVARVVGLCILQKQITGNNFHYTNGRLYLDLRLSPEVFSQYLSMLCAERMSKQSFYYNDLSDSSFPMDVNLKALIKPKCTFSMMSGSNYNAPRQIVYRTPYSPTETEASSVNRSTVKERVFELLMAYCLEKMTLFYGVMRKDFGVNCNTADCYRALFLYKCRKYDQVLPLCELILKDFDLQEGLKEFSFANVLLLPPLDSFFEKDVQSLLGFHALCHYLCPLNDDLRKIELTDESTFKRLFARYVYRDKYDLTFVMRYNYSIKCYYFLGRHFLARYLRLKCCIDCRPKLSYSEALTEFAAHKLTLPFEHIIRRFILQKLRI